MLIVGAGPTGLALALFLSQYNIKIRIIDKNKHGGQESRAIGVQARTLEFYKQLGIHKLATDGGTEATKANVTIDDKIIAKINFAKGKKITPFNFLLLYAQNDHEKLLEKHLNEKYGIYVERNTSITKYEDEGDKVKSTLKTSIKSTIESSTEPTTEPKTQKQNDSKLELAEEGEISVCVSKYLCGCDGANSFVRSKMEPEFEGETYRDVFYVLDIDSNLAKEHGLGIYFSGNQMMVTFGPLKNNCMLRLTGQFTPPNRNSKIKVSAEYKDSEDLNEELALKNISNFAPFKGINSNDKNKNGNLKVKWFSKYNIHHRLAKSFSKNNVFLLGDASHIHSPAGGQGMNTGIGDAANLGWKIAMTLQGKIDSSILSSYNKERLGFAKTLVKTTDTIFSFITNNSFYAPFMRKIIMTILGKIVSTFPAIQSKMFKKISQCDIRYEQSTLNNGSLGKVICGKRMPWVKYEEFDNLDLISYAHWNLHIYGDIKKELENEINRINLKSGVANGLISLKNLAFNKQAAKCGIVKNAIYLIRPDGYVGFTAASQNSICIKKLKQYIQSNGINN